MCYQIIAPNTCPGIIIYCFGHFLHLLKISALAYSPSIFTTIVGFQQLPRKDPYFFSDLLVWRLYLTLSPFPSNLLNFLPIPLSQVVICFLFHWSKANNWERTFSFSHHQIYQPSFLCSCKICFLCRYSKCIVRITTSSWNIYTSLAHLGFSPFLPL